MHVLKATISIVLLVAVISLVGFYYDTSKILYDIRKLSVLTVAFIIAALLSNSLAGVLRFKIIAAEIEHPIGFRRAMAVVGSGGLAGTMFFQIAGQLMARGVIAGRGGIPFAAVVVITAYERIVAAIVSALLALAGAMFIFGNVYLDTASGGAELIKIMGGFVAATVAGALLGYGRMATQWIIPLLTRHFVRRCLGIIGLTLLVQIPMMVAYVVAARALSPQTPIADLTAASAIVMFAASVPISLAGWGVREMSAVVALGTIGMGADAALTTAIIIGVGSMLAMGIITAISLPGSTGKKQPTEKRMTNSVDYYRMLAWALPIAAATLVLFQVYVPIQSGLLNVNLADPIAVLAGVIFILKAIQLRRLPQWQVAYVNIAVVVATLALAESLLIGADRFGWTTWALVNRFLGWFVLLAFGATGALIVREGGKQAMRVMLLTFAAATAAIAGLEIIFIVLRSSGFRVPVVIGGIEGFSQNHNFFAFQLLMAMCASFVFARGVYLRIGLFGLIMAGLWFAGSRSGWAAAIFVLATGIYVREVTIREIVFATACAAGITFAAVGIPIAATILSNSLSNVGGLQDLLKLPGFEDFAGRAGRAVPQIVPSGVSTHERLITLMGGFKLFMGHPIFGAGLGAFRNEMILATSGIPLLIHSTALWLLAELGIFGFLVFTVPAIYVFTKTWRRARQEQASALVVLSLVAFAVMSGPADMLYQRTFWLLIGAGLARPHLEKLTRPSGSAKTNPA